MRRAERRWIYARDDVSARRHFRRRRVDRRGLRLLQLRDVGRGDDGAVRARRGGDATGCRVRDGVMSAAVGKI